MKERNLLIGMVVLITIGILVSSSYAEKLEGLVLYYPFDTEVKDDTITDRSGNRNDAIIKGQPKQMIGNKISKAMKFEEAGQYLEVPHSKSLSPDNITIALWVKWSGQSPCKIIGKFSWNLGGYLVMIEKSGQVVFWLYKSNVVSEKYRVPKLPQNEWTHLTCTYDKEHQRVYVNGVKGGKDKNGWGNRATIDVSLKIGAYDAEETFTGMLDEVAIYNRALTEKEILKVMKEGHIPRKAVFPLNKLAATWGQIKVQY